MDEKDIQEEFHKNNQLKWQKISIEENQYKRQNLHQK